ncbi:MAG: hypothetical protein WCV63_08565 [Negativicutes bacterium]
MSSILVLVIQLAIAYWIYNDAKKIGMPQMRILMWTLGTIVIPLPMSLLVVAAYFFIGKKGVKPPQDNNTIDVQAEVLPDDEAKPEILADSKKPVMYCRMCGAEIPFDKSACPKCNSVVE